MYLYLITFICNLILNSFAHLFSFKTRQIFWLKYAAMSLLINIHDALYNGFARNPKQFVRCWQLFSSRRVEYIR